MKSTSILQNFVYNLSYEFFQYFIPLIAVPHISRVLGPAQLGRYSFAQSIVTCFVLAAELGTPAYGQRCIAQRKNDPAARQAAFLELVLLRLATTGICLAVYAAAILPLCGDVPLYALASIELWNVMMDISWYYRGVENFAVISFTNTLCQALSVTLFFLLVKRREQLYLYVLINAGGVALVSLLQWLFLKKRDTAAIQHLVPLHPFRHFRPVFTLFIANAAAEVYVVLDKTMLGLLAQNSTQSGYYEQAHKIAHVLVALVTAIGPVMASRTAHLRAGENWDKIPQLIWSSFRLVYALAFPAMAGLILIAPRFVPIFYGPGYDGVVPLLQVFSLLLVLIGTSNVIGVQYMVPIGKDKQFTLSLTIGAAVNVCLNSVLIYFLQAMGAAVASVVAECVVALAQMYFVRRELPWRKIPRIAVRYGLLSLGMFLIGVVFSRFLPHSLPGLAALVLLCVGVYLLELALLRDPVLRMDMFRKGEAGQEE